MARRLIPYVEQDHSNPWMHPVLVLSLLVAWIAASVAIFAAMCSSCPPRQAPPKPPLRTDDSASKKTETSAPAAASIEVAEGEEHRNNEGREEEEITELEGQIHGPIGPTTLPVSASKRRLSMSLSMGIPEGLNKIKTMKKERHGKAGGGEESLWKKTIILGEKCKLPNPEGDGDDAEAENKTSSSLPASRTASFANRGGDPPS